MTALNLGLKFAFDGANDPPNDDGSDTDMEGEMEEVA